MGEGKQFSSAISVFNPSQLPIPNSSESPPQNPLLQIQSKFKELEVGFDAWVSKQPVYIEAAVSTARGAALGALIGVITAIGRQALSPLPPVRPLVRVNRSEVLFGVIDASITTVSKRLRRKEDRSSHLLARMIDGFRYGSMFGTMFNIVVGQSQPVNLQLSNMAACGLLFNINRELYFSMRDGFYDGKINPEDEDYMKTKSLLKKLGMDKYERHFRSGMLNDYALPLLTNSDLKEVNIPPGARLLILDHIQRDPEIGQKPKKLLVAIVGEELS